MTACESNSQLLCSQLQWLRQATTTWTRSGCVQVFGAELKPVLLFSLFFVVFLVTPNCFSCGHFFPRGKLVSLLHKFVFSQVCPSWCTLGCPTRRLLVVRWQGGSLGGLPTRIGIGSNPCSGLCAMARRNFSAFTPLGCCAGVCRRQRSKISLFGNGVSSVDGLCYCRA